MPEFVVRCPLDERDLHDDRGLHPVHALLRQSLGARKWRRRDLDRVQRTTELDEERVVEARPDFAGEDKVVAVEISDHQCAQSDACTARIREAADDELLRGFALHLEPVRRTPMFVDRVAPFRDDALPAFGASALPRPRIVERRHQSDRQLQPELAQQRPPLLERQLRHVTAIDPEHVKHVIVRIAEPAPGAGGFTVENDIVHGQFSNRASDGRIRLVEREAIARSQLDVGSVLEREQADAVELALERPLGPREALVSQGRGHRLDPVGKSGAGRYLAASHARPSRAIAGGISWPPSNSRKVTS